MGLRLSTMLVDRPQSTLIDSDLANPQTSLLGLAIPYW